jgi:phosphoribosyl-AMP cyclohydrolase
MIPEKWIMLIQASGDTSVSDKPFSFAPQGEPDQVEEGRLLAPKFDANGLITCVVTDAWTSEVLMVAHMNSEALARTIETAEAWYYSRSRQALWRKGEQSGRTQRVVEMRIDCDQDAVVMRVEQAEPGACHTGRRSCFYRVVPLKQKLTRAYLMEFKDSEKLFDPVEVYAAPDKPSEA